MVIAFRVGRGLLVVNWSNWSNILDEKTEAQLGSMVMDLKSGRLVF